MSVFLVPFAFFFSRRLIDCVFFVPFAFFFVAWHRDTETPTAVCVFLSRVSLFPVPNAVFCPICIFYPECIYFCCPDGRLLILSRFLFFLSSRIFFVPVQGFRGSKVQGEIGF